MRRKNGIITGAALFFSCLILWAGAGAGLAQSVQILNLSPHQARIQASGFITTSPLPSWGSIVGTRDEGVNVAQGEVVYLLMEREKEAKPGDRFLIARLGPTVTHPLTKKAVGIQVLVLGEVTVLGKRDDYVAAKIGKSPHSINRGDLIVPLAAPLPELLPLRLPGEVDGVILGSQEGVDNISEKEFIFLDLGRQEGMMAGDSLAIWQAQSLAQPGFYPGRIERALGKNLPMENVGEAVVISVQENTSTAMVTRSVQPIFVGDRVLANRKIK